MRKKWIRTVAVLTTAFSLLAAACGESGGIGGGNGDSYQDYNPDKESGGGQFDFDGNYAAPELVIDGKGDDEAWKNTEVLATFGHGGAATVKAYRGEEALFFFFEVEDTILLTEGNANDDSVTRSDSIEFYLDTLADGGLKPQNDDYQINLGIHGKTRIMQGSGSGWGNWNGLIDYEVALDGTLNDGTEANDRGYSVEVMVPYSQIGIEKDDTVAVSFGQVDKFGSGSASGTDWDWYGWEFEGKLCEPQTPYNYILLDKDNNLLSRDSEEKPDADMAGYVLDSVTEEPVEGAAVTVTVDGELLSYTSDSQGYFIIEKVDSDYDYVVTVTKDGYIGNSVTYLRSELRASDGGRVLKNIYIKNEESIKKTALTGTVKNIVNGAVSGATVRVDGTLLQAETAADGSFRIEGVPAEDDVVLTVSKSGYGDSETRISKDDLVTDGDAVSDLGEVNLNLPYGETGSFGNKSEKFADSSMKISRALNGIEMNLVGTRELSGHLEIYLDAKECEDHRDNDATCWRFDLNADGTIGGTHFAGGAFVTAGLEYDLYSNGTNGYEARFFIPYEYLDITPLEVFGISLGQWSDSASDWDGWGFAGQFVAPETPKTFIRLSAINELYRQENNTSMVNLSGNAGMGGVRVAVGEYSTTTGTNGAWSMKVPAGSDKMEVVYSRQGYLTKTTEIPAGYFDTHYSWSENVTLESETVLLSGKVTDSVTGTAIKGVTVSVNGTDLTTVTDAEGKYTLSGVSTAEDIVIRFEKEGYAASEVTKTAEELSGASSHEIDVKLISDSSIHYVTATGTVTNVNGPVAGALVTVSGNSELTATTDAEGKFVIENFPAVDCTVLVEKDGYISVEFTFKAGDVESTETDFDFGTVDMMLDYAKMSGLIADKSDDFSHFTGYVTRSATGFEFKFIGEKAFTGRIELFVDTKASAGDNARDTSDYLFNLNADGTFTIVNWGEGTKNETAPADMKLTVLNKDTKPEVYFTLPYAFFGQRNAEEGITPTEVIGISLGQWSTSANNGAGDWDGWDNFALPGANGEAFVKPEMPQDYVRIGAYNEMYAKADNTALDLHSYEIHFATGENTDTAAGSRPVNEADDFYARVSNRNGEGVTFEFITTGDFSKEGTENEMVLIYFDTGATEDKADWNGVDYLIKISSDGTVYGKAGRPWWSATEADKIGSIEISRKDGVTTFSLTVKYSTLGIGAEDVFGVAMREASHNAGDHHLYDPYYDCYFGGERIDAAMPTQYVRVAADGTLYKADNNDKA